MHIVDDLIEFKLRIQARRGVAINWYYGVLRGRNVKATYAILVVRFRRVGKIRERKIETIAMSIDEFKTSRAAHETDSISFSKSCVETRGRKLMSQRICHLSLKNRRRGI
jgi:hypothetical protein